MLREGHPGDNKMLINFTQVNYLFTPSFIFQLARVHFPERVVLLEEEWGDSLIMETNYEAAINHFLGL